MSCLRAAIVSVLLVVLSMVASATPVSANDGVGSKNDENIAVAVNTEDGATVFRLAFSIVRVSNAVIDQTNAAVALASCTDCQTIALAFQVVLVQGDADIVVPENLAFAYNQECVECVTYASATQVVLGFDGRVLISGDGRRRLAAVYTSLRALERDAPTLTLVELDAEVQAAKRELLSILSTEVVEAPQPPDEPSSASTTTSTSTTTSDDGGTTSTTDDTTSTTEATATTTEPTTTTTTEPTTTTTTL